MTAIVRWSVLLLLALVGCASTSEDGAEANAALAEDPDFGAWASLAEGHGVRVRSDRPLVVGVRGRDIDGNVHPTRVTREFDDTLVVLTRDHRVVRLAVSTHPWETHDEEGAPDVDGDGTRDVGMIRPGVYSAERRASSRNIVGQPTFAVTTARGDGRLPGDRNTDHDDVYSAEEHDASTARSDRLTAVLFHRAGGGAPALIGCQGLDVEGMSVLAREGGDRFDYVLVDANAEDLPR